MSNVLLSCREVCARSPKLNIDYFGEYETVSQDKFTDAANYFHHLQFKNQDYTKLAARVLLEEIYHAAGDVSFSNYFTKHNLIDSNNYNTNELKKLDRYIRHDRDLQLSFVAVKTLCRSYLLRGSDGTGPITERPQYFFMRCAICVTAGRDMKSVIDTYNAISKFMYIHSSATLFNACKKYRQYSSCYVMSVNENNIFDKAANIKNILLSGGGLGINISGCSPTGQYKGADDRVSSIQKGIGDSVLNVLNAMVNSINPYNRRGSIAVYLDVWHPDVLDFIMSKMPHGSNTHTELFYGLNINNKFMECVVNNEPYHLIDPNTCPELVEGYSEIVYDKCCDEGKIAKTINAREIVTYIVKAQAQSGVPYIVNIEMANLYSNHRTLGKIPCSNLCTEIFQHHDETETAVCNLASVNISKFINTSDIDHDHCFREIDGCGCVNFFKLSKAVRLAVNNLNTLLDVGTYPDAHCMKSNNRHRPLGVGIQGLFDSIQKLQLSIYSDSARDFNSSISEHVYYYALDESINLAIQTGCAYETFAGSDFSRGILQFDYYKIPVYKHFIDESTWIILKRKMIKNGIKNSLLTAYMPTATVAGIFGTSEGVEPFITNVYTRSLLSGDITVVNSNLAKFLIDYGIYDDETIDSIISTGGSIQHVNLPDKVKSIFSTAYEIDPARMRLLAADRAKFIDQGQSINMYIDAGKPGAAKNIIRAYMEMYKYDMKNYVYYVYGKAPGKPMDPTLKCSDGMCCQ